MTTIAANRREMAGDSRVSFGSASYYTDKVFRIGDNIVGVAGDAALTTKFVSWLRRECPADEAQMDFGADNDKSFIALVLNSRGLFVYNDCTEPDHLHDKHFAIGSGSDYAVMAMDLGATPAKAVRHAIRRDPSTGGRIKVERLDKKPPKQRKQHLPTVKVTTPSETPDEFQQGK